MVATPPWEPTARPRPRLVARFGLLSNCEIDGDGSNWHGHGLCGFSDHNEGSVTPLQEWSWNPVSAVGSLRKRQFRRALLAGRAAVIFWVVVGSRHQEGHVPAPQCPEGGCPLGASAGSSCVLTAEHRQMTGDNDFLISSIDSGCETGS